MARAFPDMPWQMLNPFLKIPRSQVTSAHSLAAAKYKSELNTLTNKGVLEKNLQIGF